MWVTTALKPETIGPGAPLKKHKEHKKQNPPRLLGGFLKSIFLEN
jgi:hypothetical protein